MSIPPTACLISAAALGNEEAFTELAERMKVNIRHGGYSIWPCKCAEKCPRPTDEQLLALDARVKEATKGVKLERGRRRR